MLTRRKMLAAATTVGIAGPLSLCRGLLVYGQEDRNELQIPALERGQPEQGKQKFQLRLQRGSKSFLPGLQTPTFGINGDYLGPTLRFKRGESVAFTIDNQLGEPTTLHWHGFHLPPLQDGGPHQTIPDGGRWEPEFDIIQFAGTYWYHSHLLHESGRQVYMGLAGMIQVEDDTVAVDLPNEYGVDDIPLILQDRRFNSAGEFQYRSRYQDDVMGMMGDTVLVNGTYRPVFQPRSTLVRFRILNAANARSFDVALSDNREFHQIATDGGLLDAPVAMNRLRLAPAERAEILVRFEPGESVSLMSLGQDSSFPEFPGGISTMMRSLNSETFELLSLRAAGSLATDFTLPSQLTPVYRLPEAAAENSRSFLLSMGAGMRSGEDKGPGTGGRNGTGGGYGGGNYFINGRVMDMSYINERVPLNSTEIWELSNNSPMMHPFHIHNGQFQILDRNGNPPPANEIGWKDTVQVGSGERVRLIMRFTDYADVENPYMYHCHILEHEDRGMMGQFVLV